MNPPQHQRSARVRWRLIEGVKRFAQGQSAAWPSSRSNSVSMNGRKNSAPEAASCGFFGGRLAPVRRR